MHWADADRAGHRHGWMSPEYADAARDLDAMLGTLAAWSDVENDPHTMIIAVADHGGGGVTPREHHEPHPVNSTIPILFLRSGIAQRELVEVRLEDIPATIAWMLGAQVPEEYSGRVIAEALESIAEPAVA
jgi:phosphopentomutase